VLVGLDMDDDMSPKPFSLPYDDPLKEIERSFARCRASIHSSAENLASTDDDLGSSKV
jgi:hypothetical protein